MLQLVDNGSITSVPGIKAIGIHAGIKKKKKDLAIIFSEVPAVSAGTFTLNKVKAAPLIISQKLVYKEETAQAILVNSGNANACTGEQGELDALETTAYCAKLLNIPQNSVLVSSTGVIGSRLPVDTVIKGIKNAVPKLNYEGGLDAAEAIMTTDLVKKSYAVTLQLSSGTITIGGICKGSGMIMPNMATMLAFIATDAKIEKNVLQSILLDCVNHSFNKVTVDGDTSTNDMVILLANGLSGVKIEFGSDDYYKFSSALLFVTQTMAKAIARDGEGASKLVTVNVTNAQTYDDADAIAKSIANSPLVKTAVYGQDANWGRILSAAGKSSANFDPAKVTISLGDLPVFKPNYTICLDEDLAKVELEKDEVTLKVDLADGTFSSTWWTCDFTEGYIRINARYRT
ncbi:MAG: bifunctional glutamate N-acetyltransferase/amino-acid acetyltransferase ArgJ [Ignavibacteria bacterium]|nr:bifunctional glutamate N-acetyltransferase/amino-acid acetyltransferase ArgJ [Ignavibacteria bacterium]